MTTHTHRRTLVGLLLAWPIGLLLVLANVEAPFITASVFFALDAGYVVTVIVLLRRLGAAGDRSATALVVAGAGLFASVGFSGPPTAAEPGLMMVNTAALLGVALCLLVGSTAVVARYRASDAVVAALPGLLLLVVGSAVYLVNLVARFAVVLSGASDQQAAVEDTAWIAYEYLRGLGGAPDLMSFLLVWLDLLQLGYVATVYVCCAGLARLLRKQDAVSERVGRAVERAGYALAAVIVLGVALAAILPRELDVVPAWAAFVASIPFMTTLLPFVLGVAMLSTRVNARRVVGLAA